MMDSKVFISHAEADKEIAEKLAKQLENIGFSHFLAVEHVRWGEPLADRITDALSKSAIVVVIISPASLKSTWVHFEIGYAMGERKQILPYVTTGTLDLPVYLHNLAYKTDPNQIVEYFKNLGDQVSEHRTQSSISTLCHQAYHGDELHRCLHPYNEVSHTLKVMGLDLFAVDGFIEIYRSSQYVGWSRNDIVEPQIIEGEYDPPTELKQLRARYAHERSGGSQARYSLKTITAPLVDRKIIKSALKSSKYLDLFTLSRCLDKQCINQGENLVTARDIWGYSWYPLEQSPLLHNVNSQAVVITSDKKLILTKRSQEVDYYPSNWSVSLEEQMCGPEFGSQGDRTFFDCAERGVKEEQGCTPIPERSKILGVGVEHNNLSASFICVVYIEEPYDEACDKWLRKAPDPYESAAIDGLDVSIDAFVRLLINDTYNPTQAVRSRVAKKDLQSNWHPTARIRLYMLCCHLFGQDKTDEMISELGSTLKR
jgi:hypothetical protein